MAKERQDMGMRSIIGQVQALPRPALRAVGLLLALALALPTSGARAQSAKDRELLLKAAFLYNFAKFVEWPASAFSSPSAPLTVCVHGDDVLAVVGAAMKGKTVNNRPLAVVNQHRAAPPVCHIGFVTDNESAASEVAHLAVGQTLTVSDVNGFVEAGGMVGLVIVDNKIRFEVNLRAARAAGLRIQAALLRLATDVIE
jgi:hypothetical protein